MITNDTNVPFGEALVLTDGHGRLRQLEFGKNKAPPEI